MNKLLLITSILLTVCFSGVSQTVLIDPNGDGGFETGSGFAANNWSVTTGQPNQWVTGSNATIGFTGANSAYITNSLTPTTHTYNITGASKVHLFRDVTVPPSQSAISLSFSWIGQGQTGQDRIKVWVTPTSYVPTAGVLVSAAGTRTTIGTYSLQSAWTNTTMALPASLSGTTFRIIFEWVNDATLGTNPPGGIDNISLTSNCSGVTTTSASSITNSSAVLNWNTLSGATSYSVQYKDASSGTWLDAPGNPYSTSTTSASITGLTASTNYQYKVAAIGPVCNAFSSVTTFTTLCNPITTITYTENFNTVSFPSCWSSSLISGTSNWITTANNGAVPAPHAGSNFIGISGAASNALLISPQFSLNALGTAPVQINMWIYRAVPGNSDPNDSIVVYLNTASNLTGATQVLKIFPMMTKAPAEASAGWYNYIASIPASFITGSPFFVVIQGSRVSTNGIGIDDFIVELGPTCLPSTGLMASAITNTSATISWIAPSSGTPVNYIWEIRSSGAAGSGATGLVSSGTGAAPTTSASVTGLTGSTTYSLYVKTDCGAGDFSAWTSAYTFTTSPNCPATTSLAVSGISSNSVIATWTAGGSETNWDLYYGPSPLTAPTASTTPTGSVTATSFTNSGLTPSTAYQFYVRANCGSGQMSTWSGVTFNTACLSPDVLSTSSATLCGQGTLTLQASTTATATLFWYANSFGGNPINTGTVYVTPTLTTTTNYYVTSRGPVTTYTVGKAATTGAPFAPSNYLIFDAVANFTLSTVDIYAAGTGTGNVVIALQNSSGVTLQTATVNVTGTAGPVVTTVPVNFNITPGTNYRLNCLSISGGVTGLYRDNSGFTYPYTLQGIVSITGNSNPSNYNFFYNWQINAGCESPRSTVTAYIIPIPTLSVTAPASICGGSQTFTIAVTSTVSSFDSYTWLPTTNLYTNAAATIPYTGGTASQLYVKGNVTGSNTYTINASNSVNGCVNTTTSSVTIKESAVNMSLSISPGVICSGSTTSLSVSSGNTSVSPNPANYTYSWTSSPTGFTASTASTTANPTISATYSAVITNTVSNCAISGTISVVVNPYPTVTLTPVASSICTGQSATVTATGSATNYTWSPIANNTATAVVNPTVSTTYTLVSTANGCSVSNTVGITVNPKPSVSAASSQSAICVGESAVLTASTSASSYSWSPGTATTLSVSVAPATTTNYTVTVSNGTCTATSAVNVVVNLCTGINELSTGEISLYPNPNFGILNIVLPDNNLNTATLEIYDAIGKLVLKEKLSKETNAVNTSKLDDGVYIYKISYNNKDLKVGRIIKQ